MYANFEIAEFNSQVISNKYLNKRVKHSWFLDRSNLKIIMLYFVNHVQHAEKNCY